MYIDKCIRVVYFITFILDRLLYIYYYSMECSQEKWVQFQAATNVPSKTPYNGPPI